MLDARASSQSLRRTLEDALGDLFADDATPASEAVAAAAECKVEPLPDSEAAAAGDVCRAALQSRLDRSWSEARQRELSALRFNDVKALAPADDEPHAAALEAQGLVSVDRMLAELRRDDEGSQPPQWPEWGFPEDAMQAWLGELSGFLPWFRDFAFVPGMLFGSRASWWAPRGTAVQGTLRNTPNEGLDLRLYVDPSGDTHPIPADTPVPCVCDGECVAIFADACAKTIVVRHPTVVREGRTLHSLYGHVSPCTRVGRSVGALEAVGKVKMGARSRDDTGGTRASPLAAFARSCGSRGRLQAAFPATRAGRNECQVRGPLPLVGPSAPAHWRRVASSRGRTSVYVVGSASCWACSTRLPLRRGADAGALCERCRARGVPRQCRAAWLLPESHRTEQEPQRGGIESEANEHFVITKHLVGEDQSAVT